MVETSIKSPGFASDSFTTAFSLSAAISSVATSIGDFTVSLVLTVSLETGLLVSSAETEQRQKESLQKPVQLSFYEMKNVVVSIILYP